MGCAVRAAGPGDADLLARMIAELLAHEGKATAPPAPATVTDWLDPADPAFEALIGALDGEPHGYLAFYRAFSLFKPGPVLLVENLYVDATARGRGLGRELLAAAAREAVDRGWSRLELNVGHANATAVRAYAALGFSDPGEGVRRLEDSALKMLAKQAGHASRAR